MWITRVVALSLFVVGFALAGAQQPASLPPEAVDNLKHQLAALNVQKARLTPVQKKIDSNVLLTARTARGLRPLTPLPMLRTDVVPDAYGRIVVEIHANVTPGVLTSIRLAGGEVLSAVPQYGSVLASVPAASVESIASLRDVKFIGKRPPVANNVLVSEGDKAMAANVARSAFGLSGQGVKVGVMSDGIASLTKSKNAGELPSTVQVITGQAGPATGDEGTAMLEIVHDLAPNAALAYATAYDTPAQFAANIGALKTAGCKVIVDDVLYLTEPVFQDGIIAQAVESFAAAGGLYFAAIGNEGRLSAGTSGVWEGNFKDSGQTLSDGSILHSFTSTSIGTYIYDDGAGGGGGTVQLQWADPLGKSSNDYDLLIVDSGGNIVGYSASTQDGTQDPLEFMTGVPPGYFIVIAKYKGTAKFLHTNIFRGVLGYATNGDAFGHPTAARAFGVAAVDATGKTTRFTDADPIEQFSSNGPRRIYFKADGTAITPVNRQKPDLAAADGVVTSVTGFNPFYGTSAAAPHAAAVAALLAEHNKNLTYDTLLTLFKASVIDLAPAGWDVDAGWGTLLADIACLNSVVGSYKSVTLNPTAVDVGATSTGTIALTLAAPPAGVTFNLTSSDATVASVPATAKVLGGKLNVTFTVTAKKAGTATITAEMYTGGPKKSATITVNGTSVTVQSIAFKPTAVVGGKPTTGTLTLTGAAPAGGLSVTLASNNANAVVTSPITVPAGSTTTTFVVTTKPVTTKQAAKITATAGATSVSQSFTIKPPTLKSVKLAVTTIKGGNPVSGTVTLTGKAPTGGIVVNLASNVTQATVPATVTVAAGKASVTFTVTTKSVTANKVATITASRTGSVNKTATLTITP